MSTVENIEPVYLPPPPKEVCDWCALFEDMWLKQPSDDEMRMHVSELSSRTPEVITAVWCQFIEANSDTSVRVKAVWFHQWISPVLHRVLTGSK